jgi:3-deoxy-D-manno-octulosonic-acid transferase
VAEALFENLAHVVAQSERDRERFQALGARPVTVSGNLKVDVDPPSADMAKLDMLRAQIGKRPTWAAVSTHPGEELIAAEVHRMLRSRHPGLLTIIVPRHPARAAELADALYKADLKVVRRTAGGTVGPDADVLLGDTIGEMGLYLRLTEIAFVGRSLTADGGHNPLEPAMLGTAVLSGRNVQNFRETYQNLLDGGGVRLVKDKETLAGAVNYLLSNEPARREMIAAAAGTVEQMRGALDRTLKSLDPFIHPLVVKSRLEKAGGR